MLDKSVGHTTSANQTVEVRKKDNLDPTMKPSEDIDQIDRKSINEQNMYKLWPGSDIRGCRKCSFSGDKWDILAHHCRNNK